MKELSACTSDELKAIRDRADSLIHSKIEEESRLSLDKIKNNEKALSNLEELRKYKKDLSKKVRFLLSVPFVIEFEPFEDEYYSLTFFLKLRKFI